MKRGTAWMVWAVAAAAWLWGAAAKGKSVDLHFPAEGGEEVLTYEVTGIVFPVAKSDAEWLYVRASSTSLGNSLRVMTLTFTCEPNDGDGVRTATATSTIGKEDYTFHVTQDAPTAATGPNLKLEKPSGWPAAAYLATGAGKTTAADSFTTADTVYLNFCQANDGTESSGAHKVVVLLKDAANATLKTLEFGEAALGSGQSRRTTDKVLGTGLEAGAYRAVVMLDSGGAVAESNENDNGIALTFTVGGSEPLSDGVTFVFGAAGGFQRTSIPNAMTRTGGGHDEDWFSVDSPFSAAAETMKFTVKCEANAGGARSGSVTYKLDGVPFVLWVEQMAGKTAKPDLEFSTPSGWPAAVYLSSKPEGRAAETSFTLGEQVYLHFSYRNGGEAGAGEHRARVRISDSAGNKVSGWTWSSDGLAEGERKTVDKDEITRDADGNDTFSAAGTYTVTVELDSGEVVDETDENNNTRSVVFTLMEAAVAEPVISWCAVDAENGTCTVRFIAEAGKTYRMERVNGLDGTWAKTGMAVTPASRGETTLEAPIPGAWRTGFFRVSVGE